MRCRLWQRPIPLFACYSSCKKTRVSCLADEDNKLDPGVEFVFPGIKDIRESDYRVVTIKMNWNKCEVTIRCELHTEYFSTTTFVELECLEKGTLYDNIHHLLDNEIFYKPDTKDEKEAKEIDDFKQKLRNIIEPLYIEFWNDLAEDIFPDGLLETRNIPTHCG